MKRSSLTQRLVILALFLAIAAYIGIYIADALENPFRTVYAVSYTVEDECQTNGYIVRNEDPVVSDSRRVDVVVSEGATVSTGETIAKVYSDEEAYERSKELKELEESLQRLEYSLNSGVSGLDGAEMDEQIYAKLESLAYGVGSNDLSEFSSLSRDIKSLLLRRANYYNEVTGLDELAADMKSRYDTLKYQAEGETETIKSIKAGTFSGYTDGYEGSLYPTMLESMTVEDFNAIREMKAEAQSGAVGKLIFDLDWYYVTLISEEAAVRLADTKYVTVKFEGDFDSEVRMHVDSVTRSGSQRVAVFSCNKYMFDVTTLREVSARVVFGEYDGLRVPDKAICFNSDGELGVYCVNGLEAAFKRIEVVWKSADEYYIVREARDDPYALRSGEEIIVEGKDLYDGKILE